MIFYCWYDQFYELFHCLVTKEESRKISMRKTVSISAFCFKGSEFATLPRGAYPEIGNANFLSVHCEPLNRN